LGTVRILQRSLDRLLRDDCLISLKKRDLLLELCHLDPWFDDDPIFYWDQLATVSFETIHFPLPDLPFQLEFICRINEVAKKTRNLFNGIVLFIIIDSTQITCT